MKGAYLKYINLKRFFAGKSQDNVTLISTDALIYSKNSKHFKGGLGTKEPEIIIDIKPKSTIELSEVDRKDVEEEILNLEPNFVDSDDDR